MIKLRQLMGSMAACLWGMLPAVVSPVVSAAQPEVSLERLSESLRPLQKVYETPRASLYLLSVEDLHGIALVGEGGKLHMLFLQPREKSRSGADSTHFKEQTKRLHAFVASQAEHPGQVRLVPFAGGQAKAVIICTPEERRTSFSRCVLGDSTLNVIDYAVFCGATFSSLEGGLLTLIFPDKSNPAERCALILSLHTPTVEVVGFSPPPSQGKKESLAIASLTGNLRIPAATIDSKADAEVLRSVCQRVGVTRCLSKGAEYALVLYNKKLYAGRVNDLRAFVRECKKDKSADGFVGDFTFPSSSRPIPSPVTPGTPQPGADAEPGSAPARPQEETPAAKDPPAEQSATPANQDNPALQDYLRYLESLKKG